MQNAGGLGLMGSSLALHFGCVLSFAHALRRSSSRYMGCDGGRCENEGAKCGGHGVERRGTMQQPDAAILVIHTLSLHVPLASQDSVAPAGNSHLGITTTAALYLLVTTCSCFILDALLAVLHPHLTGQRGTCRQHPHGHHRCCSLGRRPGVGAYGPRAGRRFRHRPFKVLSGCIWCW